MEKNNGAVKSHRWQLPKADKDLDKLEKSLQDWEKKNADLIKKIEKKHKKEYHSLYFTTK